MNAEATHSTRKSVTFTPEQQSSPQRYTDPTSAPTKSRVNSSKAKPFESGPDFTYPFTTPKESRVYWGKTCGQHEYEEESESKEMEDASKSQEKSAFNPSFDLSQQITIDEPRSQNSKVSSHSHSHSEDNKTRTATATNSTSPKTTDQRSDELTDPTPSADPRLNDKDVYRGLHVATAAACDEAVDKWIEEATGHKVRRFLVDLSAFDGLGVNPLATKAKQTAKRRGSQTKSWDIAQEKRLMAPVGRFDGKGEEIVGTEVTKRVNVFEEKAGALAVDNYVAMGWMRRKNENKSGDGLRESRYFLLEK